MPLIVEDGTGKPDADSWISEADARAYWTDRSEAWPVAVEDGEKALRAAADYLDIAYRWPGQPRSISQRLPWPRVGVRSGLTYFPSDAIPTQLISAQLVLALEALKGSLFQKPAPTASLPIIEETKSLKGMTKSLKYAAPAVDSLSGLRRYPVIDRILLGLTTMGGTGDMATVPLRKAR